MRPEDLALQFSDEQPGYELVGYARIALPLYRLALSVITLERKRIPPVTEFVLRAIAVGVTKPSDIQNMLGLTRGMVNETIAALHHDDYLIFLRDPAGNATIALTAKGQHALEEAVSVSAQMRDAELDYDALLGQPVPFALGFLEPREVETAALRELPAGPSARKLSSHDLDLHPLTRLGRIYGVPPEVPHDLLAIEKIKRRRRIFKEALALLFVGAGREFHIAFVLDGALSTPHEQAFARAGLAKHFGIDTAIGIHPITDAVRAVIGEFDAEWDRTQDSEARAARRVRLRSQLREREGLPGEPASGETEDHEPHATDRPIEILESFELDNFLSASLEDVQERLVILSERLSGAVVTEAWISKIARLMRAGVRVFIGWGLKEKRYARTECDREAIERLTRLEQSQPSLTVRYLDNAGMNTLILDDKALVLTSQEWLASSGMPARSLGDQRGVVVRDEDRVGAEARRVLELFEYGIQADDLRLPEDRRAPRERAREPLPAGEA